VEGSSSRSGQKGERRRKPGKIGAQGGLKILPPWEKRVSSNSFEKKRGAGCAGMPRVREFF